MFVKSGIGALVLGLVLFVGSVRADDTLSNPTPGKCPVSGKDIDSTKTAVVDGKTYAFCCDKCMAKFKEHPDKFLKKGDK